MVLHLRTLSEPLTISRVDLVATFMSTLQIDTRQTPMTLSL